MFPASLKPTVQYLRLQEPCQRDVFVTEKKLLMDTVPKPPSKHFGDLQVRMTFFSVRQVVTF